MCLRPTYIPLNFETDRDHCLDKTKSGFSHLLNITCLGMGFALNEYSYLYTDTSFPTMYDLGFQINKRIAPDVLTCWKLY